MSRTETIEEARNLVLQKFGRNLVNLQKLELLLKHLLATNRLDGTATQIEQSVKRRTEKVSRMTLGQVIQELATTLFDNAELAQHQPEHSAEIRIGAKFTLGGGPEAAQKWKDDLSEILNERNQLVHHMFAGFNPDSVENCHAIELELDRQRERLIPVYNHIQSLVITHREAMQEILKQLPDEGSQ